MILELYDARRRMAQATPGSREWWRAIRDIRAVRQRFRNVVRSLFSAFKAAFSSVRDSVRSLGETFRSLSEAVDNGGAAV